MYMYALICRGCLLKWFSIMLIIIAFTIALQLAVKTTQFISGTHFMDTIAVLMSHIIIWWVVHCVTCTYTDNESTHGVSNKLICTYVHPSIQPMGICSRACIYTFSLFGVQVVWTFHIPAMYSYLTLLWEGLDCLNFDYKEVWIFGYLTFPFISHQLHVQFFSLQFSLCESVM